MGASESPAVLGDSAWGTALTVYHQKTADEVVDETTDLMEFGHLAEPVIVAFIQNHPERFSWMGDILPAEGLLQSIEWPWLLGTLDRIVRTPDGVLVPLELKSINDFTVSEWKEDVNGVTSYIVPRKYQVQVQQQMAVTGYPFAFVAVWLGKGQVEVIVVDRDDDYIEEFLVGSVGDFWNYNVIPRIPPAPTLNDDLWSVWPGDHDLNAIVASESLTEALYKWRTATDTDRELHTRIAALKFAITEYMGDVTEVLSPVTGKVVHTLRPQATPRAIDYGRLLADYPDAYEACVKPPGITRVHRATKEEL